MTKKACCFAINGKDINHKKVGLELKIGIKMLIKKSDVTKFYIGAESEFDKLCLNCLEEIKAENPDMMELCLVLNERPLKAEFSEVFLKIFDEITFLNFEKRSPQFVQLSTFNWLIENSDYLISVQENDAKQEPNVIIRDLSDKDLMFFAVRLKILRIKRGLSQAELAKAIKVSPSTIGLYEQGRREPDFQNLLDICLKLKTSPDYILGLEKKLKPRLIEIDEILFEFTAGIKQNNRLLCDGNLIDKATREKFASSLTTALEVAKRFVNRKT